MPARFSLAAMGSSAVSGTVFLVSEDCEGTGTPAGWTNANGSPNWDSTATVLDGSQSLALATTGAAAMTRTDFTNQAELWGYFMMQLTGTTPGSAQILVSFRPNGGGTPIVSMNLTPALKLSIGASVGTATATTLGTTYHVWVHYKAGTGANAIQDVGYSTNGVRPTSGGTFVQITSGAQTASLGRLELGITTTVGTVDMILDKIRIAATQIGDNGT